MRARGKAGGFWEVPAKADLHFYDPQGIRTDLVSYLLKHKDEKVIDIQIQAGLRDRLPSQMQAVHLDPEVGNRQSRRMKARTVLYQRAGTAKEFRGMGQKRVRIPRRASFERKPSAQARADCE
jgi:hypothetical protein